MASLQVVSLLLAALAITGSRAITCYHCDAYDEGCDNPEFHGAVDVCDTCTTCFTRVYHSTGEVERWVAHEPHEDGYCYIGSIYTSCYCASDRCNNHLCEQC
ncbi:unnamed protein product [Meganyctiphanes norvegica]|uniref:Uncharacterized protein n=1 Tax=Meganyctiphanes norvegica TaxID=48144 RepID=A0AAV2S4Z0_MEGNR